MRSLRIASLVWLAAFTAFGQPALEVASVKPSTDRDTIIGLFTYPGGRATLIDAEQIGVIHVGNAFGQLFAHQGHLGAMPATVHPGLWGVPASRHEAACASGSIAALAAMADLRAGNYEVALVLGLELEKTVNGDEAARSSRRGRVDRPRGRRRQVHVALHVHQGCSRSTTSATASTRRT